MYEKLTNIIFLALITLSISCQNSSSRQEGLESREKELEERIEELEKEQRKEEKDEITYGENSVSDIEDINIGELQSAYESQMKTRESKYMYITYKIEKPKLNHVSEKYIPDLKGMTTIPEMNYVTYEHEIYNSDISEINGNDENEQYRYIDLIEKYVMHQVSVADMNFNSEIIMYVRDENDKLKLKNYNAKIADRKVKIFDSYKEASIHRNNNN
jgi:hypothetical protein